MRRQVILIIFVFGVNLTSRSSFGVEKSDWSTWKSLKSYAVQCARHNGDRDADGELNQGGPFPSEPIEILLWDFRSNTPVQSPLLKIAIEGYEETRDDALGIRILDSVFDNSAEATDLSRLSLTTREKLGDIAIREKGLNAKLMITRLLLSIHSPRTRSELIRQKQLEGKLKNDLEIIKKFDRVRIALLRTGSSLQGKVDLIPIRDQILELPAGTAQRDYLWNWIKQAVERDQLTMTSAVKILAVLDQSANPRGIFSEEQSTTYLWRLSAIEAMREHEIAKFMRDYIKSGTKRTINP